MSDDSLNSGFLILIRWIQLSLVVLLHSSLVKYC